MKKSGSEEKKIVDAIKEVFIEFYNALHEDEHASAFFTSTNQLEFLIERQTLTVLNLIKAIEEGRAEDAKKVLYKVAERHYMLGLSPKALFDSINLYADLLRKYAHSMKESTINAINQMLRETTAKVYMKKSLDEAISFVNKEKQFKALNKYDSYFYEQVENHLKTMKELIDEPYQNHVKLSLVSHTNCNVFKLTEGLAFKVMFYGREDLLLEFKSVHKKVHEYTAQALAYLANQKYKEAVYLNQEMINHFYKLINIYSQIALRWKENKESIIFDFVSSYKGNFKTYLLVIEPEKSSELKDEIEREVLSFLENNLFTDFKFAFFDKVAEKISIFLDQSDPQFDLKLDKLLEGFKKLAKSLKEKYVSLVEIPILRIGKIDLSSIKKYSLDKEEISEAFYLIEESLKQEESEEVILIVDYTPQIKRIVDLVHENLEIKRIVLSQLKKEEVDLFVQKIFDLNGREFGIEILGRIKNPYDGSYIPAGKFIKILEREGVMNEFDRVILKKLRENLKEIKRISKNIFVNMYPTSFSYEPIVSEINQVVNAFKEENLNLFIELTEYAIVSNREILQYLESENVFIAFDDFGTGYTNYEIVGEIAEIGRAKAVKIDGSIVKRMLESKIYESMVESITLFSNKVNMLTVYEFVENEEILNRIRKIAEFLRLKPESILLQGFYLHIPTHYKEEIKSEK